MQGEQGNKRSEHQLAMLGHELRNALNGVIGATEMLGESGLSGEQRHLLNALQQSGKQLRWLIESVDPAGHAAGFPFTPVYGELNGINLLEQAIRCHTPAAILKNNVLLLTVEPDIPERWYSDARLLRQVIDNLLGNAIKFTQSGQVEVEVRHAVGNRAKAGALELFVHDNGPGISMDDSRQIFEPWAQLDEGKAGEGVGLGLHVCRQILSILNGRIDYCRGSGGGSCFRVYLPGAFDSGMHSQSRMAPGLYSNMSCLVSVRDELSKSLNSLLARLGVRACLNGQERAVEDDVDLQILITEPQIYPAGSSCQNGLRFTPKPLDGRNSALPGSRRLQAPFLESTLGPLLMEMSLEWRMAKPVSTKNPIRGQVSCQKISDKPD